MNNACPLRITAAAGTKLAGTTFLKTSFSSSTLELYNLMFSTVVIAHMILLDQDFSHCPRFPTAALKSQGLVSVPVWLYILSDQLRIIGLVSFYPTNNLILHFWISKRTFSFLLLFLETIVKYSGFFEKSKFTWTWRHHNKNVLLTRSPLNKIFYGITIKFLITFDLHVLSIP